ncbi:MAG TPA: RsmE family RNA methyltransferase, partial [Lacipirellulaceae bacterium]|nr:RsmE family RNA methyltransferase [Lacipirellulaceae bacterium]
MSDRFFIAQPITTESVTLDGPEAHHLLHVMRGAAGTPITLFDNSGDEFEAVVETARRSDAIVRILERRETSRELPFSLVAGVALPKGDRQKWLVEKLTELGVTMLVPLDTERGVAQPTANAAERLQRSVIEAAKQCGRNKLMGIADPQPWDDWTNSNVGCLESSANQPPAAPRRLLAHPGGTQFQDIDLNTPTATAFAIGPEGGFTEAEVAVAVATGWQQVALGPRILRVETAAIALAAAIAL